MSDRTYGDCMREQEEADRAEALRAVVNNPPKPNGGDFGKEQAQAAPEWPAPSPIPGGLPPVKPFSEDLLPGAFRPLVRDISERMQVPIDCPAAAVTVCLAGAVNRRATIQPKVNDTDWIVVPNLWGAIVAPPGFMKSPVIHAATQPLMQIQNQYWADYQNALSEFEFTKEEAELRKSVRKERFKSQVRKGSNAKLERPPEPPDEPILRRLIVNDSTFEALHQTLNNNPASVLVIRDELTGWWSMLDRSGREGERAFFLEAWNGNSSFIMDRVGRGTIYVPACCVSMLGGIQPARLRTFLLDALRDGPTNDGLVQRQQLLVWPDFDSKWVYVDRAPDASSVDRARAVFERLVAITPDHPVRLRFCPDAQDLFVSWLSELEAKVRSDDLHPALRSHLSNYRSLMPSLAALFELADRVIHGSVGFVGSALGSLPVIEVSLEHAQQAAGWCDYLETHARRMYSCMTTPALLAARELADKIKQRKVGSDDGFFSCRNVYTKGWSGLDTPEIVKPAVEVLQDAGWVREVPGEPGPLGGRPSSRFQINPRVWQ
jgi:putative DNA primase/helicase